ncbi:hypothetical protein E1176_11580 [Fulvivirga sp. RKSG066]|uniref:hypothetical protein n=1 Tax=Fulvivirga aurantia TaxID=2529383 RepID=UPI0012BBE46B|nr:hypothetical protein [Fulvivirga aurantia]MTI21662.1 hypothetical protein [Fulvivirga aurantia]
MDIKTALLQEHSRNQAEKIAQYIGSNEEKFAELMTLFFSDTYRVTQRAAWPMSICSDEHPELIRPYLKQMINSLSATVHVAVKRNTVRALQNIDIPEELRGIAAENCFNLLASGDEPIAVKVFAMTVLANICKIEPDLSHELRILIEDQMPYGSAGFKSRGNKILKQLDKLVR